MADIKHTPGEQLPLPSDHKRHPVTKGGKHTTRKPKYELFVISKENTKDKTRAGVAWESEEGYISILLGPGIMLTSQMMRTCYISLYPTDAKSPPFIDDEL